MARATPATHAARAAGIAFALRDYAYDASADHIGLAVAAALGEPPARVWKTLMLRADADAVCAVLASDRAVALKALAAAVGAKAARLMPSTEAERATGYRVGGISPFGQRRPARILIDDSVRTLPYLFVNAGRRGLQMRLTPADLVRGTGATLAAFTA